MCQTVVVPLNTTATLINLIQFGDNWASENNGVEEGRFERFRKGEKVPGCMADVRITTSFKYAVNDHIGGINAADIASELPIWPTICIDGSADSRVAQGILALLCKVNTSPYNIPRLHPFYHPILFSDQFASPLTEYFQLFIGIK